MIHSNYPKQDHILIWEGLALPHLVHNLVPLPATCVGTLPQWEPTWQYLLHKEARIAPTLMSNLHPSHLRVIHTITMLTASWIQRSNSTTVNLHPKPFDLNPNQKIQKDNVSFETKVLINQLELNHPMDYLCTWNNSPIPMQCGSHSLCRLHSLPLSWYDKSSLNNIILQAP